MLTPIEMQSKVFSKSGMGYSKVDVDAYFGTVASDYESLYKENLNLKEKINLLNESLNHYKEIEKSLQKALVLAETTAEETILGARKNATVIEQEAVLKAQTIVADAKVELDQFQARTADLLRQYENYKASYRALAAAQIELLDSDAFKIEISTQASMKSLKKDADAHMDALDAAPVYQGAQEAPTAEEDFDETLSGEDSMIKDFSAIFSEE